MKTEISVTTESAHNQLSENNCINEIIDEIIIETKNKESKYDYSKKLQLVRKINKIKKKDYLLNIFKIILKDNKDFSENNNGVFIFFHNLTDETYEKLEMYVNYIFKLHQKNTNSELSDSIKNSDIISSIAMGAINDNKKEIHVSGNLSNKEKSLLRRKKYEEYINCNQNI
jgi:hypothetical protein